MARLGRPPFDATVREAFWRAYVGGVLVREAAARTGVSTQCGRNWLRETGGMRPRPPAPPTARYLSLSEREDIALARERGLGVRAIARQLGRAPSTVSRELARNARPDGSYRAVPAQQRAVGRLGRPKLAKLAANGDLQAYVQAKLQDTWSPQQISARLPDQFPDRPEMRVSHEAIYQALFVQGRGALRRELTACLRTGRALRRPRHSIGRRDTRIPDKVMISQRPAEAQDRAVPGHWEGDLIVGAGNATAIGTLVERSSRFCLLVHLPVDHTATSVRDALIATIAQLPQTLRRSLTWDQGIELTRHAEISLATDLAIYFCDPHSPWQRGSNENTNGLLRQFFPKGTDLSVHTPDRLREVAELLNDRPRQTLGWRTPHETLATLVATTG